MRKPVLAQYTIRSKQSYIFQTNKMLEVVGASANISNAWIELFDVAKKLEIKCRRAVEEKESFLISSVLKEFEEAKLQLVELFYGGGNLTVLYDCRETFVRVNKVFSYRLLQSCPGMLPMAVAVEYTGNYREDYKKLMDAAEVEKNRMVPCDDNFILPFSKMDRNTYRPLSVTNQQGVQLSYESYGKAKAGRSKRDDSIKYLDTMITRKGEESLLAIVHADGNNMGRKIVDLLQDETDYSVCIPLMREFTFDTAQAFNVDGLEALEKCSESLKERYKDKNLAPKYYAYRVIVADGDDMTFVCNARFVMEYVREYVKAVQTYRDRRKSKWQYSCCAGICIFHSHYPFARACSMAEKACDDGAKKKVHSTGADDIAVVEEGWVDFHCIHSGLGGDLEELRLRQNTYNKMARPWRLAGMTEAEDEFSYEKLVKLYEICKARSVYRNNIKTLGAAWEDSKEDGYRELSRVYGHAPGLKEDLAALKLSEERLMQSFYDLSEVYELWFEEVK